MDLYFVGGAEFVVNRSGILNYVLEDSEAQRCAIHYSGVQDFRLWNIRFPDFVFDV